jgi:hypothetical protein
VTPRKAGVGNTAGKSLWMVGPNWVAAETLNTTQLNSTQHSFIKQTEIDTAIGLKIPFKMKKKITI